MQDFLFYLFSDLIEPVLRTVFYPLGWPLMKVLTMGRYPAKGSWLRATSQSDLTAFVGLAVALVGMMAMLGQFNVL